MDDGVAIAFTRYTPDGAAPPGARPGVVVLHGLGGNRGTVASIATSFADAGYSVLAYDARGHGESGGDVTLAGPREVADLRAVRNAFAARPDVSDTRIGAWGISYGGGQIWNALAAGVPFAAAEVVETWTSLYDALWPQNLARSGIVGGFAASVAARSPLISEPAGRGGAEHRPRCDQAVGRRALGAAEGRLDQDADVPLPGPSRLRVRHLAGDTCLSRAWRDRSGSTSAPSATLPPRSPALTSRSCSRKDVAWFDAHLKGAADRPQAAGDHRIAERQEDEVRGLAEDADADVHARRALRAPRRLRRDPPDSAVACSPRDLGQRHGDRDRAEARELPAARRQRPRRAEGRSPRWVAPEGRRQPRHARELLRLRPTRDASPRDRRCLVACRTVRLPGLRRAPDRRRSGRSRSSSPLSRNRSPDEAGRSPSRARARVDRGRSRDGRSRRHGEEDPDRRHCSALRRSVGVRRRRPRREGVLRLRERPGRRERANDRLPLLRRCLQPGEHRPADTATRRAGQGLRDLQLRRHREQQGDPAVPEPAQGAAALRRRRCAGDVAAHSLPVDDGVPPELRRRGRRLRPPSRQDPQGGEDRSPLPERRSRKGHDERPRASDRGQGPSDRREGELRVHRHRRLLADRRR